MIMITTTELRIPVMNGKNAANVFRWEYAKKYFLFSHCDHIQMKCALN